MNSAPLPPCRVEAETRKKSILKKSERSDSLSRGSDPETEQLLGNDNLSYIDPVTSSAVPFPKRDYDLLARSWQTHPTPHKLISIPHLIPSLNSPTESMSSFNPKSDRQSPVLNETISSKPLQSSASLLLTHEASLSQSFDISDADLVVATKEIQTFASKTKYERSREQLNNNSKDKEGCERISQDDSGIGCGISLEILTGPSPETGFSLNSPSPTLAQLERAEGEFSFADSSPSDESKLLTASASGPTS